MGVQDSTRQVLYFRLYFSLLVRAKNLVYLNSFKQISIDTNKKDISGITRKTRNLHVNKNKSKNKAQVFLMISFEIFNL